MKNFLNFVLDRLKERSTWLGLVSLGTALGLLLSQSQQEAVVAAGMALAGAIAALTGDGEG